MGRLKKHGAFFGVAPVLLSIALILLSIGSVQWFGALPDSATTMEETSIILFAAAFFMALGCAFFMADQRRYYRGRVAQLEMDAEVLKRQTTLDGFTGLYNKKHVQELLEERLALPSSEPRVLFMLDINDLKHINDQYGHQEGDDIILYLSDLLKGMFSEPDISGRIGGDEFMALSYADHTRACVMAREMVERINARQTDEAAKPVLRVSVGIVSIPAAGLSFEEAYRRVDQAMYTAKRQGGSGYVMA